MCPNNEKFGAMSVKPVACAGDVSATAGTTMFTGAQTGSWTPGPVSPTEYSHLTVGGVATLAQASCTFLFSGASASMAPVSGSSTVTLSPAATVLQFGGANILRDGDQASDSYGNALSASSTRIFASA